MKTLEVHLPKVIGHRGAARYAPENTLAGIRKAAALGAGWVEIDIRLLRDGNLAVIHDATLDRTTDGHGPVIRQNAASLCALDAGSWFGRRFRGERVPLLGDVLDLADNLGLGVNIEVKRSNGREKQTAAALIGVLRAMPRRPPVLVSSFSVPMLKAVRAADRALALGFLAERPNALSLAQARVLGCVSFHCNASRLRAGDVARIKEAEMYACAYTVNDADQAGRLWGWGVDAVFSDIPDVIIVAAR
ncbi:MAG: glycerophosphoryl diester phosphodiesterase [Rhodospirillales bacterium]|nr:glycerophosphoryl diester phosphodiesterase [Rhodospirillales bacterium]